EAARARRNDRASFRPSLGNRRATASGSVQLDFVDSGKPNAVDLCRRALENRGVGIDLDPHPHEFRAFGQQRNLRNLADRDSGEGHVRAFVEPSHGLREVDVVTFGRLVREAGDPDDEQQRPDEERHGHHPDHHIVRPRFHQLCWCSTMSSCPRAAARPRGPLKYSCIQGWSKANSSGIVPTPSTLLSANTATRSHTAYSESRSWVIRNTVSPSLF